MNPGELEERRAALRDFVERRLVPLEPDLPVEGLPGEPLLKELQAEARSGGFWGLSAPVEFGGQGLGVLENAVLLEEIMRTTVSGVSGGYYGAGIFGGNPPAIIVSHGTERQHELYVRPVAEEGCGYFIAMSEPGAGSDPGGMMTTTAARTDGGWVLNGVKGMMSEYFLARFGVVFAVTDPEKRQRGGITAFIVSADNPGVAVDGETGTMSGKIATWIRLTDCFVPDADVLGEVGQGFALGQQWFGRIRTLYYGAGMLGPAARALEIAAAYANERHTFGEPLAARQAIQFMLADSAMQITSVRALTHDTARKLDAGERCRTESAMVKIMGTEMAWDILDRALQILGGIGYTNRYPIERMMRTVRLFRITEGANEVHRAFVARELLKDDAATLPRPFVA
ncbi:acyl-CoA/acyl-ACP dehydrogenase [Pseudonocardia kujensis]|uniref:acyl-CoA dehydrogenase family protein n=1 Tax=Pseudonocardia kujensis TaxID=1128675 RepID=UPI001E5D2AA3|nr:acyl-CoA dehydrogenase family protein [Pseudonocardia kujensis]MCE0765983.1 acyl-CoA/acyl-ACP dehydrogenase [Pseudonocardia kujensis]